MKIYDAIDEKIKDLEDEILYWQDLCSSQIKETEMSFKDLENDVLYWKEQKEISVAAKDRIIERQENEIRRLNNEIDSIRHELYRAQNRTAELDAQLYASRERNL
jgi:hypothetical protein